MRDYRDQLSPVAVLLDYLHFLVEAVRGAKLE